MSQLLTNFRADGESKACLGATNQGPGARSWDVTGVLSLVAILGLTFQIGHFAEHAVQFAVWLLGDLSNICGRGTPWMSPWATALVQQLGVLLFPTRDTPSQMMLGMEVLHLIGNSIFLTSLVCLYCWLPSKWVRWALYIEAFHLYEHISLTTTAYFLGRPIGMSTLFGAANVVGDREFAVGCRVTWHFVMNLLPMPFAMVGLMEQYKQSDRDRSPGAVLQASNSCTPMRSFPPTSLRPPIAARRCGRSPRNVLADGPAVLSRDAECSG